MSKNKKDLKWYDSGNMITTLMISIILIIVVCSQSFAVMGESSLAFFGSVINHNTIYFFVLIYFVLLKLKFGKRYFNYLNVFLIFIYFLATTTSFLTILPSFSLNTVIVFLINLVFLIYLIHTMLRDTSIWREFSLTKSPFNELGNDWYFYTITLMSALLLIVNLISTVMFSGVVLAILDFCYAVLFGRYIYLYRDYLDTKKKDSNNTGNFDEIRESIKESVEVASSKVVSLIENNNFDETIEKVMDKVDDIYDKTSEFINDKKKDIKKNAKTSSKKSSNTKKKGDKQ